MKHKSKADLLQEIERLQRRIAELEAKGGAPDITERKRKEEEASRMVTVVRDSNDAITIQDFEGKVLAWNRGAELMYGYSEEEALQKNIWLLTPPGREEEQKEFTRRLIAGEAITSLETQRKTKDGRILDVWMTVTKLVDDAGKPIGIASTERDITMRKQAEKDRDFLINLSADLICVTGMDGFFKFVNPAWKTVLGYSREELLSKPFLTFIHPEDHHKNDEEVADLASGKTTIGFENRYLHKDGSIRTIFWTATPLLEEKVMYCIGRDITERKRAEEALASSEQFLNNVIEQGPVSLWISDSEGTLIKINQACRELLGVTDEEAVGKYNLFSDNVIEEQGFMPLVKNVFEKGEIARFTIDYDLPRVEHIEVKEGTHRILDVVVSPINDIHGKLTNAVVQHMDITERKQAEKSLQESELKFREIMQYLDEGYYNCTVDGRLQEHNRAFNRILGFDLGQDLKGSLLPDFWQNPDDRKGYLAELMSRGFVRNFLIDAKTICGEKLIVMANSHLVKDEKGTPVRIEGTFTDFTERRRAEKELQAANQQLTASNQQLKATEQQLRASNQQLEAGMERLAEAQAIARLGNWEYDAVKDVISGSDEFCRLFGVGHDQLRTYQAFFDLLHPDDREQVGRDVQESLTKKALYDTEYRVRLPNGDYRDIHARGRVFADEAGKPVRMVGTCLDITERKRAEEERDSAFQQLRAANQQLEASNQQLRATERQLRQGAELLNATGRIAKVGGWEVDAKTLEVIWTEQTYRLHEVPLDCRPRLEEAINFFHPEEQPKLKNAIQRALEHGEPYDMEIRFITAGGNHLWTRTCCEPEIVDGKTVRLKGVFQDITDRKQAEDVLIIRNRIADVFLTVPDDEMFAEVLKIVLEIMQSPYGVFGYIDEAGALVVPSMTRHIWDKCQVPEKTITFPRDKWGDSSWPRAIREKRANYTNRESANTPEGHINIRRHISLPILFRGEVIGLLQVANKITDYMESDLHTLETISGIIAPVLDARLKRARQEEELKKVFADLTRSNKELEQFAYVASHDLQEPLRMVSSYTQLFAQRYKDQLDDKAEKYIDYVVDGAVRMQRLINDLLIYSRVGTRGKPLEPTDSHSVLGEALRNLQVAIDESRAIITNDDLPTLRADASQLGQVFQNLIANAIKFRGEFPPRIHVSARDRGREWFFSVSDNGIGIDPQHKDRVFVIFQRLHSKQEYPGTGIGLALCKKIVERHGGNIWFESEPGKGSTFFFTIPK